MQTLTLHQLKVRTTIGVHPWEQPIKQTLLLDIEITGDFSAAAQTDDLSQGIDYSQIAEMAETFAVNFRGQLVEHFAQQLLKQFSSRLPKNTIKLTVHKPHAISNCGNVTFSLKTQGNQ